MSEDNTPKPDPSPKEGRDLVTAGMEEAREWKQRRADLNMAVPAPLPDSIGPYKVIRRIGAGGMGVVYEAEQAEPCRRVAVKVIRGPVGADTHHLRLFQREIQVLGRLRHPAIAQIYDASHTEDGQQYFVMELVDGRPLVEFCELVDLSLRDRLALFAEVCRAVQYAHQRGVIHRDLKPANILVDENGKPHVLDFGLARIVDPEADITCSLLAGKAFIGTLPYMSPEQTRTDPADLDIRTDVYSLGVILYEMLTGTYPYRVAGQIAEVLRNIAEAEPKKPSTIRRQINDEVETIVLKTLSKERERRYQSAETLAQDVEHYLNGEPILAKRNSSWYLLKKLVHRNAARIAATVLVMVLLATSSSLLVRSRLASLREQQTIRQGEIGHIEELVQHGVYTDARDAALALIEQDPSDFDARWWYACAFFHLGDRAGSEEQLNILKGSHPTEASVYWLLSEVKRASDPGQAGEYMEIAKAHGKDTARERYLRAMMTPDDEPGAAIKLLTEALELRPDYFEALMGRCVRRYAVDDFQQALMDADGAFRLRPGDGRAWYNSGTALLRLQKCDQAVTRLERAVALRPDLAEAFCNLGLARECLREWGRARDAYRRVLELSPGSAQARLGLGRSECNLGRHPEGLAALSQAIELQGPYSKGFDELGACRPRQTLTAKLRGLIELVVVEPTYLPDAWDEAFWIQLAEGTYVHGNLEALRRQATRAAEQTPADPRVWRSRALAELRAEDYRNAKAWARKAIELGGHRDWNAAIWCWAEAGLGREETAWNIREEIAEHLARADSPDTRLKAFLVELDAN